MRIIRKLIPFAEAEAIRLTGEAHAEAYRAGVSALGSEAFIGLQIFQIIGERSVRIVPDVSVSGGGTGSLTDGLLALLMRNQSGAGRLFPPAAPSTPAPIEE